jgi:hypothetical protein
MAKPADTTHQQIPPKPNQTKRNGTTLETKPNWEPPIGHQWELHFHVPPSQQGQKKKKKILAGKTGSRGGKNTQEREREREREAHIHTHTHARWKDSIFFLPFSLSLSLFFCLSCTPLQNGL